MWWFDTLLLLPLESHEVQCQHHSVKTSSKAIQDIGQPLGNLSLENFMKRIRTWRRNCGAHLTDVVLLLTSYLPFPFLLFSSINKLNFVFEIVFLTTSLKVCFNFAHCTLILHLCMNNNNGNESLNIEPLFCTFQQGFRQLQFQCWLPRLSVVDKIFQVHPKKAI